MPQNVISVRVTGIEEIITRLLRLDANISGILRIAIEASGAKCIEECKRRCPVDTGRLKGSIGEASEDGIWDLNITRNSANLKLGSAVEYAWDVEVVARAHGVGQAHYMEEGSSAAAPFIQNYFEQAFKFAVEGI